MAPIGGFIRLVKHELWYLDAGFYGRGSPHLGIEAVVEAYSKFFLHFGTLTLLRVQLRMSVKLVMIEMVCHHNRFFLTITDMEIAPLTASAQSSGHVYVALISTATLPAMQRLYGLWQS
jgi:hypothetical protein